MNVSCYMIKLDFWTLTCYKMVSARVLASSKDAIEEIDSTKLNYKGRLHKRHLNLIKRKIMKLLHCVFNYSQITPFYVVSHDFQN